MDWGTHRERIVAAVRASSQPLDDDQLADQTGISPRQTVNQICRALRDAEMVRRQVGPSGKIVNEWLGDRSERVAHVPEGRSAAVASAGALGGDPAGLYDLEIPAGSSREQLDAERVMLDLLGDQLGQELHPARITIPSGSMSRSMALMRPGPYWWNAGHTRVRRSQRSATRCWPTRLSLPGSPGRCIRDRISSCA